MCVCGGVAFISSAGSLLLLMVMMMTMVLSSSGLLQDTDIKKTETNKKRVSRCLFLSFVAR